MNKLKVGLYWAASCGGCEIAVLELHEKILDLLEVADIVFWPCVMDFKYDDVRTMPDQFMDLVLFNGAIRTDENEEIATLLRKKTKTLVAFGACATLGGIPGLANFTGRKAILQRSFLTTPSTVNPSGILPQSRTEVGEGMDIGLTDVKEDVLTLLDVVDVDYFMPGCPPSEKQIWPVLEAVANGQLPPKGSLIGAGEKSVCDECAMEKKGTRVARFRRPHEIIPDPNRCLLEQGIVCSGPATRSGCGAACPQVNMPCRGCYGPAASHLDQGAQMASVLGTIMDPEDRDTLEKEMDRVADPAGTFYRFGLPGSVPGARTREPEES